MRVALITEGGYPYAAGTSDTWCDRLLRGLSHHDVEICAFSRNRRQAAGGLTPTPPHVTLVRTAALWGPPAPATGGGPSWLARQYTAAFAELVGALWEQEPTGAEHAREAGAEAGARGESAPADRFATALLALADAAVAHGGLAAWLLSPEATRVLTAACRAPGAPRAVRLAPAAELAAGCRHLERLLRPLSLPWYGALPRPRGAAPVPEDPGLGAVRLCHAVGTGPAALPGLLAWHLHGVPLRVTPSGVEARAVRPAAGASAGFPAHAVAPTAPSAPVRALLAAVRDRLTAAVRAAAVPEPGRYPVAAGGPLQGAEPFQGGGPGEYREPAATEVSAVAGPGGPGVGCPAARGWVGPASPPGGHGRPGPLGREPIPPARRPAPPGAAAPPGPPAGHRATTAGAPPGHPSGSRAGHHAPGTTRQGENDESAAARGERVPRTLYRGPAGG